MRQHCSCPITWLRYVAVKALAKLDEGQNEKFTMTVCLYGGFNVRYLLHFLRFCVLCTNEVCLFYLQLA